MRAADFPLSVAYLLLARGVPPVPYLLLLPVRFAATCVVSSSRSSAIGRFFVIAVNLHLPIAPEPGH
jgi:hypothetical protein